ncbi:MAG: four helix bundle protein [Candidatus Moranbacteria bacterium]|nr:four helix bundle protein [Candidatus Moranbacteria bacterium]
MNDNNAESKNKPKYDLEERTTEFAKRVIRLCRALPKNSINERLKSQATGSAGSIGANYREANDALGKKDFIHRLRIARKEVKEALHWLELIQEANPEFEKRMRDLIQEGKEIKNILCSIIDKTQNKEKSA